MTRVFVSNTHPILVPECWTCWVFLGRQFKRNGYGIFEERDGVWVPVPSEPLDKEAA